MSGSKQAIPANPENSGAAVLRFEEAAVIVEFDTGRGAKPVVGFHVLTRLGSSDGVALPDRSGGLPTSEPGNGF